MVKKKLLVVLLSISTISSAVGMPVFADEIESEIAEVTETVEADETEEASIPYAEDEIVSEEAEEDIVYEEADEFISEDVEPEVEATEILNDFSLMSTSGTYYSEYNLWYDAATHTVTAVDNVPSVTIPAYIDGYIVTAIANYAFKDCYNLVDVSIPNTVTAIGSGAFNGCTSLESITIPKSVENGNHWFEKCTSLKTR